MQKNQKIKFNTSADLKEGFFMGVSWLEDETKVYKVKDKDNFIHIIKKEQLV